MNTLNLTMENPPEKNNDSPSFNKLKRCFTLGKKLGENDIKITCESYNVGSKEKIELTTKNLKIFLKLQNECYNSGRSIKLVSDVGYNIGLIGRC